MRCLGKLGSLWARAAFRSTESLAAAEPDAREAARRRSRDDSSRGAGGFGTALANKPRSRVTEKVAKGSIEGPWF